jgi:anthranilate synthase
MQFIEDNERSPRRWYGGAVGMIGCNGNMNTGLTLRTIRIADGVAQIRVGATLLYDSDPEAEDAECRLKASALLDAIRRPTPRNRTASAVGDRPGEGRRLLLVDHQDSFVHTLGNYFRQLGAEVTTLRPEAARESIRRHAPNLVVLSPGPGCPADFATAATIGTALEAGVPLFGVCLGLQGMVEFFGGELDVLGYPMHGKASIVRVRPGRLFQSLPESFRVGRYHSLYARQEGVPADLEVTAETDDDRVVMAVEHRSLPVAGVQFHPESILTLEDQIGLRLIGNVLRNYASHSAARPEPVF